MIAPSPFKVGGRVGPRHFYGRRSADQEVPQRLAGGECIGSLIAPRQTGKSSLISRLNVAGATKAVVDFRMLGHQAEADPFTTWCEFFRTFCAQFPKSSATANLNAWCDTVRARVPEQLFGAFLEEFARVETQTSGRLLIICDELDMLHAHPRFAGPFLDGLMLAADKLESLDCAVLVAGVLPPHFFLEDGASWRGGFEVRIPDFGADPESVALWSSPFSGHITGAEAKVRKILEQTGGHPYLTCKLCDQLWHQPDAEVDTLVSEYVTCQKNGTHQDSQLTAPDECIQTGWRHAYGALEAYQRLLEGQQPLPTTRDDAMRLLESSGVIKPAKLPYEVRCPIFAKLYDRSWAKRLQADLGSQHNQEQRRSARRLLEGKRILIINMGGTLGMRMGISQMEAPSDDPEFRALYPRVDEAIDYDVLPLQPRDGSNIFPEDWTTLATAIYQRRNDDYAGFVVVHGTDTMAYTASAVAYALGSGLRKPVVFVGSQAPHTVDHGDAEVNLLRAVKVAAENLPEVVICYNDSVFRAVRADKKDDYRFDAFHSPTYKPIATIAETIEFSGDWRRERREKERVASRDFRLQAEFDSRILRVVQYPGLSRDFLLALLNASGSSPDLHISAVMIQSFGLGNLPTHDGERHYNLLPVIERSVELGIPVVINSSYPIQPEQATKYRPAQAPKDRKAISAGNMTVPAAFTKLAWLLPQWRSSIDSGDIKRGLEFVELQRLLDADYIGELDTISPQ